jgi:hypothetical protein
MTNATEVVCPNYDETHPSTTEMFPKLGQCISCTEPEEVGMVAWHKAMSTWLNHGATMRLLKEHDLAGEDMTELGNINNGMAAHTLYAWMGY